MLAMIILIVLSIIFLIGAIIYSNYKKKNINSKLIKQGLEVKNKKSNKNLKDILDIQIKDCFIKVGNRYSSILRLGNIDYHMLSDNEQEAIENVLIQTALSVDYPIQFYNTTEIIDTSKIINIMKENEVTSYKANEYKQHMIKYLQELMEDRNITVIRNYAIISYDGLFEDAQTELIRLYNFFKSNLLRAKIQTELLEEIDLYNLIFRELNKNSKVKLENIGGENLYVGKTKKNKKTKK
mgnify:FL=1